MNYLRYLQNHVLSTYFLDMDREAFIETQAQPLLEHEETTEYSAAKEEVEKEEKVEEEEKEVKEKK